MSDHDEALSDTKDDLTQRETALLRSSANMTRNSSSSVADASLPSPSSRVAPTSSIAEAIEPAETEEMAQSTDSIPIPAQQRQISNARFAEHENGDNNRDEDGNRKSRYSESSVTPTKASSHQIEAARMALQRSATLRSKLSLSRANSKSGNEGDEPGAFVVLLNDEAGNTAQNFPTNFIKTSRYNFLTFLPLNLWQQFHRFANCYFLACILIQLIPNVSPFPIYTTIIPLVVILAVSAIKDGVEDYNRHRLDYEANNREFMLLRNFKAKSAYHRVGTFRGSLSHVSPHVSVTSHKKTGAQQSNIELASMPPSSASSRRQLAPLQDPNEGWLAPITSKDICVGHILKIKKGDEFPADLVILSSSSNDGTAFVNTANLDGEAVAKVRVAPACTSAALTPQKVLALSGRLKAEAANANLYQFQARLELNVADEPQPVGHTGDGGSNPLSGAPTPPLQRGVSVSELRINEQGEEVMVDTLLQIKQNRAANVDRSGRQLFPVGDQQLCLRGSRLVNTEWIYGLVVYTGYQTKMMLNRNAPRVKGSYFESGLNKLVVSLFIFNFLICLMLSIPFALRSTSWSQAYHVSYPGGVGWLLDFLTQYILLSYMIPISLYVTIELVRVGQTLFMQWDRRMHYRDPVTREWKKASVKSSSLNEELGCIDYIFSDKTGTLTQNKMELSAMSVDGNIYFERSAAEIAIEEEAMYGSADDSGKTEKELEQERALAESRRQERVEQEKREAEANPTSKSAMVSDLMALAMNKRAQHLNTSSEEHKQLDGEDDGSRNIEFEFFANILTCNSVTPQYKAVKRPKAATAIRLPGSSLLGRGKSSLVARSSQNSKDQQQEQRVVAVEEEAKSGAPPVVKSSSQEDALTEDDSEGIKRWQFQSQSPDEMALCETCHRHGLTMSARRGNAITITYQPPQNAASSSQLPAESPRGPRDSLGARKRSNASLAGGGPSDLSSLPEAEEIVFTVMATLEFTSTRARMSVVVRTPEDQYRLYVKGADSAIYKLLAPEETVNDEQGEPTSMAAKTARHVETFAGAGSRTLCYAYRPLTHDEFDSWEKTYQQAVNALDDREALIELSFEELEHSMRLLGCTGVEDQLQEYVPEAIDFMIKAGVKVIVLTGDKKETAVTIARQSNLVPDSFHLCYMQGAKREPAKESLDKAVKELGKLSDGQMCALAIDGLCMEICLKYYRAEFIRMFQSCATIVAYRSTPRQKALCVAMGKVDLNASVLAIGDGANDVSMIQEARVGVGILGKEGAHAAMAADYVIHRFYHLVYLLFVQGRYNFYRTSKVVHFSFYKNMLYSFPQIYFSFYSLNTGQTLYVSVYQSAFNLLFTSLPPLFAGWYEKDLPDELVLNHPETFHFFKKESIFVFREFLLWILSSIWAGTVLYFFMHFAILGDNDASGEISQDGRPVYLWLMGSIVLFAVVVLGNLKFITSLEYITWISVCVSLIGIVFYIAAMALFGGTFFLSFSPEGYQIIYAIFATNLTWTYMALVLGVVYIPTLLIHAYTSLYRPNSAQKLKVWWYSKSAKERANTHNSVFADL